jgi:hypothetical protein
MVDNPRWANAEQTLVLAERDGVTVHIPADPHNADYRRLTEGDAEAGTDPVEIAPWAG